MPPLGWIWGIMQHHSSPTRWALSPASSLRNYLGRQAYGKIVLVTAKIQSRHSLPTVNPCTTTMTVIVENNSSKFALPVKRHARRSGCRAAPCQSYFEEHIKIHPPTYQPTPTHRTEPNRIESYVTIYTICTCKK